MNVSFWFDPACPFCWMTSRWIRTIAPQRDLVVSWKPISLMVKNNLPETSPFFPVVSRTRDLLRVVESVRAGGGADAIGDLYSAFGRFIHHEKNTQFDVAAALESLGLDSAHAAAIDDADFDITIQASMDDAFALVGKDVGTPIIAIEGKAGRVGLFGPVITTFPVGDTAPQLWDAFVVMAETPGFFELKRTRTSSPDLPPLEVG